MKNKMKFGQVLLMISVLVLPFTIAQDVSTTSISVSSLEKEAGVLPSNTLFYKLDILLDELKILFASQENKAKIIIEVANERLAEKVIMLKKNKVELSTKAEAERLTQIKKLEKLSINKEILKEKLQKHILRLEDVKKEVPTEAQTGITNAITESQKVIDKIEKPGIEKKQGIEKPVTWMSGDVNADESVNSLDVKYLLAYFKGEAPTPNPLLRGDSNGNCVVNQQDVTYLVNYLERGGPAPVKGNC